MQRLDSNQRSRAYETRGDDRTPLPCVAGIPGRTRTFSLWFWRPLRCQLRYRDIAWMVGVRGFEPRAPASQTQRSDMTELYTVGW